MKYICFDIGNVLCRVDFSNFKNRISKILNIEVREVDYFLGRTQKLHDLGLTNLDDELRDHFKLKSSVIVDDLMQEWRATITMDDLMLKFLNSIFENNWFTNKVALLSNIGFEHSLIVKELLTPQIYDKCVKFFSCQVGARKPNFIYYKTFLEMYTEFQGAIYVDDREENVFMGNEFGLQSIVFDLDKLNAKPFDKIKEISKLQNLVSG